MDMGSLDVMSKLLFMIDKLLSICYSIKTYLGNGISIRLNISNYLISKKKSQVKLKFHTKRRSSAYDRNKDT